jgi:hypothetical protein
VTADRNPLPESIAVDEHLIGRGFLVVHLASPQVHEAKAVRDAAVQEATIRVGATLQLDVGPDKGV